jgi:MoaA/NifB/PqqE/SkfB family radical SAM enzyme
LPLQSVETIAELPLLSAEDLKAPLRRVGEERYHHQHPFHRMMHQGELSRGQTQAWALNRYYYQSRIPIKDATIHSRSEDPDFRRIQFDNLRERSLEWIWRESAVLQRFRGEEWIPEPCKGCDRRTEDFGGWRCQVLLVIRDVTAIDPVCSLSPDHHLIESARSAAAADVVEIARSYRTSMG